MTSLAKRNKHSIYPVEDGVVWDMYKRAVSSFWTVEEIDFRKDKQQYAELNSDEQHFIKIILCFFAGADALVNNNLMQRFITEIDNPEIKCFYAFQMFIECVHQETYSLMIDTLIDKHEKGVCFNAIEKIPTIKQKAQWCETYTKSNESLSKRLVAFAIVEGLFFSGAFCAIYWLKSYQKAKMHGLCTSNEFIARDEALHTEFAVYLYKKIGLRLPESEVHEMFKAAVEIEAEFICEALPCRLIGINSDSMTEYIKFVADRLLLQLGYDRLFRSRNPFAFMEMISIESKTNFFEKRVSEYSKSDGFNRECEDAFAGL